MSEIKETLKNLGIQQITSYYKNRNMISKSCIMTEIMMITNDIWYYLIELQKNMNQDLGLIIRENMLDDEIHMLFWVFKKCRCCNVHYRSYPSSLYNSELIDFKSIVLLKCNCQCNKACCYLHKAFHYNKYHVWI
jgi:hypothetical protein